MDPRIEIRDAEAAPSADLPILDLAVKILCSDCHQRQEKMCSWEVVCTNSRTVVGGLHPILHFFSPVLTFFGTICNIPYLLPRLSLVFSTVLSTPSDTPHLAPTNLSLNLIESSPCVADGTHSSLRCRLGPCVADVFELSTHISIPFCRVSQWPTRATSRLLTANPVTAVIFKAQTNCSASYRIPLLVPRTKSETVPFVSEW